MISNPSRTSNSARYNLGSASPRLRASRASMASIAESAGTQDDLLQDGISLGEIECFATPDTSPKDASAQKAPLPIAKV
jgi:hypothetical protein